MAKCILKVVCYLCLILGVVCVCEFLYRAPVQDLPSPWYTRALQYVPFQELDIHWTDRYVAAANNYANIVVDAGVCAFSGVVEYFGKKHDIWTWMGVVGSTLELIYDYSYNTVIAFINLCVQLIDWITQFSGYMYGVISIKLWPIMFNGALSLAIFFVLYKYLWPSSKIQTLRSNQLVKVKNRTMSSSPCEAVDHIPAFRFIGKICLICLLLSIPWEFIRLYQHQFARQAAITLKGMPEQCMPDKTTYMSTLRHWLTSLFSWSPDPCIEYHKALLVDPVWEIAPLNVLVSAFMRCISQPVIVLSDTVPQALRKVFAEIPVLWQPVFMLLVCVISVFVVLATCRYTIYTPILRLAPASTRCETCDICTRRFPNSHCGRGDSLIDSRGQRDDGFVDRDKSPIRQRQSLKGSILR